MPIIFSIGRLATGNQAKAREHVREILLRNGNGLLSMLRDAVVLDGVGPGRVLVESKGLPIPFKVNWFFSPVGSCLFNSHVLFRSRW